MEEPNNVLKTYEKVNMPDGSCDAILAIRITVLVIIGFIIIGSWFFGDNLFEELSLTAQMILGTLAIGTIFCGSKTIPTPSDIEIWFYNDYFVVYRNKRYYSRNASYREFNKFYYNDVSEMNYDCLTYRFNIYGKIDAIFFKYDKMGNLPQKPHYHRITNGGICYFYVINNDQENVISTMEKYVGKKIIYRNKPEEQV